MGCHISKWKNNDTMLDHRASRASISTKSKDIVQEMWIDLKPAAKNFGVALFLRLFEESPDIQELFYNFKDIQYEDELIKSLEELDHVARVMNAFGSCIELLGDVGQFTDSVQRLGTTHMKIGIKPEHLKIFGEILLDTISEFSQTTWTREKNKAWAEALDMLSENFAIGLRGEKHLR